MIMGMESIDKGTFEVGETVQVGYADQTHKDIDPKKTVYQVVSGGQEFIRMGGKEVNARAYLSKFNFAGADQEKLCGVLSGGERNRLHLALTLKADANVLLLDEPTNDIDVNTLRALEEGLENFAGCAVVVSHDRWFLDRICTHILRSRAIPTWSSTKGPIPSTRNTNVRHWATPSRNGYAIAN